MEIPDEDFPNSGRISLDPLAGVLAYHHLPGIDAISKLPYSSNDSTFHAVPAF